MNLVHLVHGNEHLQHFDFIKCCRHPLHNRQLMMGCTSQGQLITALFNERHSVKRLPWPQHIECFYSHLM